MSELRLNESEYKTQMEELRHLLEASNSRSEEKDAQISEAEEKISALQSKLEKHDQVCSLTLECLFQLSWRPSRALTFA